MLVVALVDILKVEEVIERGGGDTLEVNAGILAVIGGAVFPIFATVESVDVGTLSIFVVVGDVFLTVEGGTVVLSVERAVF